MRTFSGNNRLVVVALACLGFLGLCLLPAMAARFNPGAEILSGSSGSARVKTTGKKTKLKKHATNLMPSADVKAMNLTHFDQLVNLGLMVRAADGSARPTLKKTVLDYWFWCVFANGQEELLANGSTDFDKYGNASADANVLPTTLAGGYCERFRATMAFGGRGKLPEDSEIIANLNATPVPDTGCVPDNMTQCLNGGRFQVEVDWRGPGANTGQPGFSQGLADDSGLFWFFAQDNWEMLIKVLDGCAVNDHYWVFAAATTNVEYTLTVTDTLSGSTREYFNPLGTAAPAITDTSAFATCP